jgi:hypothetical protein
MDIQHQRNKSEFRLSAISAFRAILADENAILADGNDNDNIYMHWAIRDEVDQWSVASTADKMRCRSLIQRTLLIEHQGSPIRMR